MDEEGDLRELECQDSPHMPLDTSLCLPTWPHPCRQGFQQEGAPPDRAEDGHAGLAEKLPLHMGAQGCRLEVGSTPTFLMAQGAREVSSGAGHKNSEQKSHRA